MPEPDLSSEFMVRSVTETGQNVKTKPDHHKRAALGLSEYSPAGPKPPVCVPVAGKRQIGPAAMDHPFA
jgi:hypothetical protein